MEQGLTFNVHAENYAWYMGLMRMVKDRLRVNVKVHNNTHLLQEGQIFLFNHFARFETAVPPYLIYEATGQYCRSVAHHTLFNVSEGLTKFLTDMGAVPNNMPGLLPFLAAEILRGRKVMIFPEGGMVKDRRVLTDDGRYQIFSPTRQAYKEVHRGAAALALTLDMFKRRIRNRFEVGDTKRIEHWCKALGIADPQDLLREANKPTLLVPSTISFYPLRTDENFLSRTAALFAKHLSDQALEELIVEGNILLKDTDMDIYMGEPLEVASEWSWWQCWLLNNYFETRVQRLDDLFDLHKHAETWQEKLLLSKIDHETDSIRRAYSHALYTGVMVNFGHVAASVLTALLQQGAKKVERPLYHRMVYLAIKHLQQQQDVPLHRSIKQPERYRGLLEGTSGALTQFLQSCTATGLVEPTATEYVLLEKLRKEQAFHVVRRENPVAVYANEVAHLTPVRQAVQQAIAEAGSAAPAGLAAHQFDDELRVYQHTRQDFDHAQTKLPLKTGQVKDGAPYFYLPAVPSSPQAKVGVLLVHGFTSSPRELRAFGRHVNGLGYPVLGVRLAGHGTSPYDLAGKTRAEWLASVRRSYNILAATVDKVVVIGFSTGGTLALKFAAEQPEKLAGLAVVAAPIGVQDKNMHLLPLVEGLNKLARIVPGVSGLLSFYGDSTSQPGINYEVMPIKALNELRLLIKDVKSLLSGVTLPTLILQGDKDDVVNPRSAKTIHDRLGSTDKVLQWIPDGAHALIRGNVGLTWPTLEQFIARFTPASSAPGAEAEEVTYVH